MRKMKFVFLVILFVALPAFAQTAAITNYCVLGAKQAATSGLDSSNYLQGIIPECTVTVYLTGTTTPATIYSDASSTVLTNPFTANADGSWLFFAAVNQGYDVKFSGGISPNVYSAPITLTGLYPSQEFVNAGTLTSFSAPAGSWPSWLVPTVTNSTTTPSLAVTAGIVPAANGGTGISTVSSTGIPVVLSGTWSVDSVLPVSLGGTGAATAPADTVFGNPTSAAAAPEFTASPIVTNITATGTSTAAVSYAQNSASIGPRYDVTQFGAPGMTEGTTGSMTAGSTTLFLSSTAGPLARRSVGTTLIIPGAGPSGANLTATVLFDYGGNYTLTMNVAASTTVTNVVIDDTIGIQAAFDACHAGYGGIVEFPGPRTYVVSSTIKAYDGCQIEGTIGKFNTGYTSPLINWNGAAAGTAYSITGFTAASNSTPIYTPSSPTDANPYIVIFSATNSLTVGQWVYITGLTSSGGINLNRTIAQVASATTSTFTITIPYNLTTGTFTDSGTATTANVVIAFDAAAHFQQSISNIFISGATAFDVALYFGDRVDTGTRLWNVDVYGAGDYGFYFASGGINVDFDKGWRADANGLAGIYWKVAGADSFGIANGTITNNSSGTYGGASVVLDNAGGCSTQNIHFTARNMKLETNSPIIPGMSSFTLYDCPAQTAGEQFFLDFDTMWAAPAGQTTAGVNISSIAVIPANDKAVVLDAVNSLFPKGIGSNTSLPFIGIPELTRSTTLSNGAQPFLYYAPSIASSAATPVNSAAFANLIGDINISQLWQHSVHASAYLYSDTAFAALSNATTLYAGQIMAPPAYWNGANGNRYAIDDVYQTGTTGTLNSGATTCTGTSGASVLTCSSATDLSTGQRVTIGTDINKTISYVDATSASAVLVHLTSNLAATYSTATTLTFSAPVLGPELQFPTKTSAAPTTLTWLQGDMEQNSGATANGIAAWINVTAGTPGTWAGIPLGNSSGLLAESQISGLVSDLAAKESAGVSTNFSCTAGAASGSGATCVCETNHNCTNRSGDLTLTTGTGTTTGTAATVVLYGSAQTPYPNCSAEVHTSAAVSTVGYTLENSTGFTRYAFAAPAASTAYTIHYQCGN